MESSCSYNDIAVPPTPAERPEVDLEQIPADARLLDAQITYMASAGIAAGISADATLMSQSIREDIGAMLAIFGAKKAKDGAALLQFMKTKGWLVPPPLHLTINKVSTFN